jgi:predicted porin
MKKSLLAVAAMGAFASAAQAQSSVTVYGLMDLGYIGTNLRSANNGVSNTSTVPSVGGVLKTNVNSFGADAESTSRLGFKGTEDLGGGMSAFFTIETAVSPNAGNAISSSTDTAMRQAFVGLKKNGIGNFSLGTQYTTIHNAVAATDPGMQNNLMGNVIYDKWAGLAAAQSGSTFSNSSVAQWNAGNQNNTSYTVRSRNMLRAESETMAGFKVNGFYVMNNSQSTQTSTYATSATGNVVTQTGGVNNTTGWGLGADYTWQKLLVTANYQTFKAQTTPTSVTSTTAGVATSVTAASVPGYYGGSSVGGTNAVDVQQYYAGTYDFGILKAYAQYVNRKVSSIYSTTSYATRTAQQLGVRSFITPTIESWASAGMGKINEIGSGGPSAKFTGYQLGTNYWLSKRTNLYAIYGQQGTSNVQLSTATNASLQNPTSYNGSNYALGIRHTF